MSQPVFQVCAIDKFVARAVRQGIEPDCPFRSFIGESRGHIAVGVPRIRQRRQPVVRCPRKHEVQAQMCPEQLIFLAADAGERPPLVVDHQPHPVVYELPTHGPVRVETAPGRELHVRFIEPQVIAAVPVRPVARGIHEPGPLTDVMADYAERHELVGPLERDAHKRVIGDISLHADGRAEIVKLTAEVDIAD